MSLRIPLIIVIVYGIYLYYELKFSINNDVDSYVVVQINEFNWFKDRIREGLPTASKTVWENIAQTRSVQKPSTLQSDMFQ